MTKIVLILLVISNTKPCLTYPKPIENSGSKLSAFVCNVTDEISEHQIETTAIASLDDNFSSRFFDDFHQCMSTDVTMVQIDLKSANIDVTLKGIDFVIVIGDDIDWVNIVDNYFIIKF
jgi:hypothetical protein